MPSSTGEFSYQSDTEISFSHILRMSMDAVSRRVPLFGGVSAAEDAAGSPAASSCERSDAFLNNDINNPTTPAENGDASADAVVVVIPSTLRGTMDVSVSSMGSVGRFGNQFFQYFFARAVAERLGCAVKTPEWVGRYLFPEASGDDLIPGATGGDIDGAAGLETLVARARDFSPLGVAVETETQALLANSTFAALLVRRVAEQNPGRNLFEETDGVPPRDEKRGPMMVGVSHDEVPMSDSSDQGECSIATTPRVRHSPVPAPPATVVAAAINASNIGGNTRDGRGHHGGSSADDHPTTLSLSTSSSSSSSSRDSSRSDIHNLDDTVPTVSSCGGSTCSASTVSADDENNNNNNSDETSTNTTTTTSTTTAAASAESDRCVRVTGEGALADPSALAGRDLWGWYQHNTSAYTESDRALARRVFRPRADVEASLSAALERLRGRGRTVVAIHVRRGDYGSIATTSFGFEAPTAWYAAKLDALWPTLDNPVLYVATDDRTGAVVSDFARFRPETADSIGASMPESASGLGAGFFPDHYVLSHADVAVISNSTFSHSACMLNGRPGALFFRVTHTGEVISFDPWGSQPILHRKVEEGVLAKTYGALRVVYRTGGWRAVARYVALELPMEAAREAALHATLAVPNHGQKGTKS